MADAVETVVAESSPVVVEAPAVPAKPTVDPLQEGPMVTWTREQRNEFRATGKTPETQPKAAPAPAKQSSEAPAESAAASEAAKQQENTEAHRQAKPKQTAEERIAQLEATIEKIRKGAGIDRTQQHADSSTANPEPKPKPVEAPQPIYTRPKPKPEGMNQDGKPYESYEEYVEDLADWSGEQKLAKWQRDQQQQAMAKELNAKIAEAKTRYPNYDEVIEPAVDAILGDKDVVGVVKAMLNESEILPDLMFTIGSKPEDLAHFVKMAKNDPGKALRYIALTESLIREELEGKTAPPADKVVTPPAKPQTQAPKPPAEVGGRGNTPPDALVAAAQANDFRSFKAELNRRSLARLKTG